MFRLYSRCYVRYLNNESVTFLPSFTTLPPGVSTHVTGATTSPYPGCGLQITATTDCLMYDDWMLG